MTLQVTRYETERVNGQISQAIDRYVRQLESRQQQISRIVRALLEAPELRSLLQAADDPSGEATRNNLKQIVFGRDVQTVLEARESCPAFHLLLNPAHDVLVATAATDPKLESYLAQGKGAGRWTRWSAPGRRRRTTSRSFNTWLRRAVCFWRWVCR